MTPIQPNLRAAASGSNPTGQPPPRLGGGSVAPGCSASECQICHVPFEFGDIIIGKDGGRKFCYYCAAKAADMFETTSALIGKVTEVENGWEVAFAPDCTTWITVRRDEHDEPKVGDFITVTVPKAVAIHSQPNPTVEPRAADLP